MPIITTNYELRKKFLNEILLKHLFKLLKLKVIKNLPKRQIGFYDNKAVKQICD
jgi:hypothetical protein